MLSIGSDSLRTLTVLSFAMRFVLIFGFLVCPGVLFAQPKPDEQVNTPRVAEFLENEVLYQAINFESIDYPLLRSAIFFYTNEERKKAGLAPLIHQTAIENAAQGHADDMVKYGFYSHTSKIKNKRTVSDRLRLAGVNAGFMGENICSTYGLQYQIGRKVNPPYPKGQFTYAFTSKREVIPPHTYSSLAKSVVKLWMDSPGHRSNILNPNFKTMGCGVRVYPERSFYNMPYFMAVQNFSGN